MTPLEQGFLTGAAHGIGISSAELGDYDYQPRGPADYAGLNSYMLHVASAARVPEPAVLRPTLYGASAINAIIHGCNYDRPDKAYETLLTVGNGLTYPLREDIGQFWRDRITGDCGLMSYTLWHALRALGFDAVRLSYDGRMPSVGSVPDTHETVAVWLVELGAYAVIDPTFNALFMTGDDSAAHPYRIADAGTRPVFSLNRGEREIGGKLPSGWVSVLKPSFFAAPARIETSEGVLDARADPESWTFPDGTVEERGDGPPLIERIRAAARLDQGPAGDPRYLQPLGMNGLQNPLVAGYETA